MKYPETRKFNLLITVAVPPNLGKGGMPRKRTVQGKPVMTEKLFNPRHSSDIQGEKRHGAYPTLFDPRQSKSRKLELESVQRLKENIQKVNAAVPFPKMIL